jgi:hypothetical protein
MRHTYENRTGEMGTVTDMPVDAPKFTIREDYDPDGERLSADTVSVWERRAPASAQETGSVVFDWIGAVLYRDRHNLSLNRGFCFENFQLLPKEDYTVAELPSPLPLRLRSHQR